MPAQTLAYAILADALIGGGTYDAFDNANAHLGVGDGDTAHSGAQTDLVGSNKTRKAMEATYPQRDGAKLTFVSVFGTGDANYAWEEVGLFNAASSGQMFSRLVEDFGTKTSAEIRTLTYEIEIQAPA